MNLTPAPDLILIAVHDAGADNSSIFKPDNAAPVFPYGKVISCGANVKGYSTGDKLIFNPNVFQGFDRNHHKYPIGFLHWTGVLAVLEIDEANPDLTLISQRPSEPNMTIIRPNY